MRDHNGKTDEIIIKETLAMQLQLLSERCTRTKSVLLQIKLTEAILKIAKILLDY